MEKRGADGSVAYLGKTGSSSFDFPIENLKKHFIALGSSGSGKTVLLKAIIEECAINGIPSIVVDPQGDLSSLAMPAEEAVIEAKGLPIEGRVAMNDAVNVTVFTPISSKGIPICLSPFRIGRHNADEEEIIPIIHSVAISVAKLLGYDTENDAGRSAEAIIYTVLKHYYDEQKQIRTFEQFSEILQNLSPELKAEIKAYVISEKELGQLIRKVKFLDVGEKRLLFQFGIPVDINLLLGKGKRSKTQVSVIYLNTLQDQQEKEFFVSILTTQLYQWMLDHPSKDLQCLYCIDEISPYLPAGSEKPIPKGILKLLFKQARKYGVGCLIATQNPGDIDYKAFAQFATWAIGRLSIRQDQKKVEQALKSVSSADLSSKLPNLAPGKFLLFAPDLNEGLIELSVRWLYTKHQTLTEEDIKKLMDGKRKDYARFFIPDKSLKGKGAGFREEEGETLLHFVPINISAVKRIAEKGRQRPLLVGPKEELVSITKQLVPYLHSTIRIPEKKWFGLRNQISEYSLFFNLMTGSLVTIKDRELEEQKLPLAELKPIPRLASRRFNIEESEISGKKLEPRLKPVQLYKALKTSSKSLSFVSDRVVYMPEFEVKYQHKDSTRIMIIRGFNGEVV